MYTRGVNARGGAVWLAVLLTGCSLLVDTSDLDTASASSGTGSDGGAGRDKDAATPSVDGGARDGAGVDASNGCKGNGGAAMIRVTPSACIDATETSRAEYSKFLDATGMKPLPGLPAPCSYKTNHTPAKWPPSEAQMSLPAANLDWCDAWAYCHWVGKQLCGSLTGEQVPENRHADIDGDLWYRACSNAGANVYPWGASFDEARCNGPSGPGQGSLVPVGSVSTCAGGLLGLFDMAGNVQEWEDSCEGTTANSGCADRGGAYIHHDATPGESTRLQCSFRDVTARNVQADNNGIRCCSYD